ncbi:hypothetical protein V8C35DRAFT_329105 [Trichoderma chlorosporum]
MRFSHRPPFTLAIFITSLVWPTAASSPSPLPVNLDVVPLPPTVAGIDTESCVWSRDGSVILCPFFETQNPTQSQIAYIRADGSGYTCLTCQLNHQNGIGYLNALPDQKTVFFATTAQSNASGVEVPGANVEPQLLHCSPSVLDCQEANIYPIAIPQLNNNSDVIELREPRVSPDGNHFLVSIVRKDGFLMLLGDLIQTVNGDRPVAYTVQNMRVLNPSNHTPPKTSADWANRMAWYEGKAFFKGNTVLYASTRAQGFNFDDWSLDLSTGQSTRITKCLEWDEDIALDPSGKYYLFGSARQFHNQLRSLSAMDLPPFLDYTLTGFSGDSVLGAPLGRLHLLEKWLLPADEYDNDNCNAGQMLNNKTGGWTSGAAKFPWHPNGTMAAWGERGPGNSTRLVTARFPTLPAIDPLYCESPEQDSLCQTATPTWAPLLEDYPLLQDGVYIIESAAAGGGRALLTTSGVRGLLNKVTYDNFSTESGVIIKGQETQTIDITSRSVKASINVSLSGSSNGEGSYSISAKEQSTSSSLAICGIANSTVDGTIRITHQGEWNPACGFVMPGACPNGADADATPRGQGGNVSLPWACE